MQSSTYYADEFTQACGRRYVTEVHVDASGVAHRYEYLAPAVWGATEYTAVMTARAAQIDENMAEAEFNEILGA